MREGKKEKREMEKERKRERECGKKKYIEREMSK